MGIKKLQNLVKIPSVLTILFLALPGTSHSEEGLTAEGYCRLNITFLQNQVNAWQSKINVLNQNHEDAEHFLALEEALISQEQTELDSVFAAHQVTMGHFFVFGRTHRAQIEQYLEANPEVAQQIADLESQLQNLVDEYESLLSTYGVRGPEE